MPAAGFGSERGRVSGAETSGVEATMPNYNAFERTCVEAVSCDRCFTKMGIARASVDLAQPRYVGPKYWAATDRKLFLMTNPGAGNGSASDQSMRRDIISYRSQELNLEQLFDRQRQLILEWGRGKFLAFVEKLGSSLDDVALLNVAWCATQGNKYPSGMLQTYFAAHTRHALAALQPTMIIACGAPAQKFATSAELSFVPAPHYAAHFAINFDAVRKKTFKATQSFGILCLEAIDNALDEVSSTKSDHGTTRKSRYSDREVIRLVRRSNPKTGMSAKRFDCYRDGMTVAEYRAEVARRLGRSEAGKCRADLRWDMDRNFIRIEPH